MATILVVDDEIGIRELLSEILNDEGHEIVLADNAAVARGLYAQKNFDLVLLDIWMPDMDGMSLLREWASAQLLHCPVVMMSGHASIDTALEAQNLGAASFLEKPITLHKLLSTVHKVLSKHADKKPTVITINGTINSDSDITLIQPVISSAAVTVIPTELMKALGNEGGRQSNITSLMVANMDKNTCIDTDIDTPINTVNTVNVASVDISNTVSHLSPWHQVLSVTELDTGLREFRESVERVYFNYILQRENWSMTRVAEAAGLERTHLYRKLKQLNIDLPRKGKLP
jgi:DNA-binding NtrC family response regulator